MKKVLNVQATLERIDQDESRLKDLYAIALKEFPKWRTNLKEHIESGMVEKIQKTAHSYKGSSATLGAERLNQLFLDIEYAARDNNIEQINSLYEGSFEDEMAELEQAVRDYIQSGD